MPSFLRKRSPIFKYFPQFEKVDFCGLSKDKIITFQTEESGQKGILLLHSIIRQDEVEIWKGCQELITNILTNIETKLNGIFRFELLSIAMSEDFEKFQWTEFSKGMLELAKKLSIGETQFVQYCSILGTLTKYAYEDFGKITFNPHVKMFDQEPEDIDHILENMIKEIQKDNAFSGHRQVIFYDLSQRPMYNSNNQLQIKNLQKMSRKLDNNPKTTLDSIILIDGNGSHDLFQKSQLEMDLFNL